MADRGYIREIEEQAALFALGALVGEEARQFEQRLASGCPLCRAELNQCQQAVAALPLTLPEMTPPPDLRTRILERAGTVERPKKPRKPRALIVRPGDTNWEPSPVPGVELRPLLGQKTVLLRMAPRTTLPAHPHGSAEQCLVLEGSISSEGVTAYAGDFTYMPAGSSHQELYSEDGCLLLIAYT